MKYITNMFGQCPFEDAVNMIDIHLQYLDFVPEDTPDYQRFPLQKESFLKKLNKRERSELEDVIRRLRGLQKDLAKCVADNNIDKASFQKKAETYNLLDKE
tara:strand:- start:212 stop:514 length:303 start_codon:yes stop_codon:yes gene_type:complete